MTYFHSIGSYIELSGGQVFYRKQEALQVIHEDDLSPEHISIVVHSIFAAAMEICHFNAFLSLTNTDTVLLSFDFKQALMMIHEGVVTTGDS